jgi:putative redox protein
VLEFCNARQIPTDKVSLTQEVSNLHEDDQGKRSLAKVALTVNLPPEFPERYRKAIVKAAELCSVKKAIMHPPEFVVDYQVL